MFEFPESHGPHYHRASEIRRQRAERQSKKASEDTQELNIIKVKKNSAGKLLAAILTIPFPIVTVAEMVFLFVSLQANRYPIDQMLAVTCVSAFIWMISGVSFILGLAIFMNV